jgi:hypothetical protein
MGDLARRGSPAGMAVARSCFTFLMTATSWRPSLRKRLRISTWHSGGVVQGSGQFAGMGHFRGRQGISAQARFTVVLNWLSLLKIR